jgi:uncharacterized protein
MTVKAAIEAGDASALRALLAGDPSNANTLIRWGNNDCIATHPLHYVSDMLFQGTLERGKELALIDALLAAGADVNFRTEQNESALHGAASLGAESVALRLIEAGADVHARGIFGETALHWAAIMGAPRLVERLVGAGVDINQEDRKYKSPPLGWALHGWRENLPASDSRHHEVVALLVNAGATVKPEWLTEAEAAGESAILAVLRGEV